MSYLPKKVVSDNVKTRNVRHGEEYYTIFEAYFGTDPYSKKPIRKSDKTSEGLKKKIDAFYKQLGAGGDAAVLLNAYQSMDARNAIDLLVKNGLNISLTECARRIVEKADDFKPCTTTLADAYAKYYAEQSAKSQHQRKSVRTRVGKWIEVFGGDRLVSDVTAQELSKDLDSRVYDEKDPKTKTTYNNHLSYIKTFMRWCTFPEQSYIRTSPIATMKLKTKEWKDPEYLSAKDARLLFSVLEAHKDESPADLADAILSFFCAMRQDEIRRVRLGESAVRISLENRNIRVVKCKGASKGVKPRSFTIPNTALAWMQSFDFMSAVMLKNNKVRDHLVKRAKEAGIKSLPENAGRHTFITMHAAAYHDQNLLTNIAGNTDDVRSEHYDGLTFENEGKAYFSILPGLADAQTNKNGEATASSESD